jgi:ribosome maturation factor RimP
MAQASESVRSIAQPLLAARDLELYDVEIHSSLVRVIVDSPVGVSLDVLGEVTRELSRALDEVDPISHRYTLEVTSPGVERPLRGPEQFARAVGENVVVKTTPGADGVRRVRGELVGADESGITVREAESDVDHRLTYGEVAKARTVFEWGAPSSADTSGKNKRKRERRS